MTTTRTDHEASPLQSKKFVAFLVAYVCATAVEVLVIASHWGTMPAGAVALLLAAIIVQGFVATCYIIGVAALDKYVRVAKIAADAGQAITMKGLTIDTPKPAPPKEEKKPPSEG